MQISLWAQLIFELIGTMVLIILGCGVVACVSLRKSKGEGGGWIVVTLAWGLAVMCGVLIAGPYTGAHLNPAVSLGLAIAGKFPWGYVLPYICAQIIGAFIGACIVYFFYKDHFDATEDADTKLGVFCTIPAISNPWRNFLSEAIGTFILVFVILFIGSEANAAIMDSNSVTPHPIGLGSIGAIPVTLLIVAIGLSLGGTTGYAINPARDLGPRLAHFVLAIKGKGSCRWGYVWVPILGPIAGGALAAIAWVCIDGFVLKL